jgi:hypothetical protein
MHKILVFFFLFVSCSIVIAQNIRLTGRVIDASSGEPISYANIAVQHTTLGTISDPDGYFDFTFPRQAGDTIVFSSMGYLQTTAPITGFSLRDIVVNLTPSNINLPEVVIVPGENPAEVLLRKIIKAKPQNNQEEFAFFSCEIYNRVRFDLNNFDEDLKQSRLLRPFSFVFENTDTSAVNGKTYVPVFITESVSDFYFRKNPKTYREIIKASKVSGFENESITQFLGNMYVQTNIYDNYIVLFDKNFVSPIANNGLTFYRYYLTDSITMENHRCYRIDFKPKRKQELTFEGYMWIDSATYAVCSFAMTMAPDANINYVGYLYMTSDYVYYDSLWVKDKESFIADLNLMPASKESPGFFAHKVTSFKHYNLSEPSDFGVFDESGLVIRAENFGNTSEAYWQNIRHDSLMAEDAGVYEMIDSIQNVRAYKTWADIIQMVATGYWVGKNLEYGPYASLLSFNEAEGTRFRFGMRTSNEFSTKIMPYGHIAYGLSDEKFKYGIGAMYMLSKIPRRSVDVQFKYDYELLGKSENAFREDFFFSTVFSRQPLSHLTMIRQLKFKYEHEWLSGFSVHLLFHYKELFSSADNSFSFRTDGFLKQKNSITSTETGIQLRYAHKERFVSGEFERKSLGSKYPVVRFRAFRGFDEYTYWRLSLNITHWFNFRNLGWSKYSLDAGMISGTLPYPFLKLHEGNESFVFDEMAFNMMNYYEYVSDQWVSMYYTHHFDGLFFNHIPLLRKLKFREVIWAKALVGSLSEENRTYNILSDNTTALSVPYIEAGVGIENILRVIRVDAGWRLTEKTHSKTGGFTLLIGFQFYL